MESENVNPNGDNVVARKLINVNLFLTLKIVKIEFKKEDRMSFFLKDAMIAKKTKFLISFTSQINIE
jgi:hypothetical protein